MGSNVTFSVDANGTGLTYQWQKQDANGTWVNIGGATASSYTINSVQAIHAGIYRVAITNTNGGVAYSSNSVLNVAAPQNTPGTKKWEYNIGSQIFSSPAIDRNARSTSVPMMVNSTHLIPMAPRNGRTHLLLGHQLEVLPQSALTAQSTLDHTAEKFMRLIKIAPKSGLLRLVMQFAEHQPSVRMVQSILVQQTLNFMP